MSVLTEVYVLMLLIWLQEYVEVLELEMDLVQELDLEMELEVELEPEVELELESLPVVWAILTVKQDKFVMDQVEILEHV